MPPSVSRDQLKGRIRHYLEAAWNSPEPEVTSSRSKQTEEWSQQDRDACDGRVCDPMEDPPHVYLGAERLPESLAQIRQAMRKTFPDIRLTITDLIAEEEKVAVRWMMHGTDSGGYENYLPTGRPIQVTGMTMLRLENNSLREEWIEIDIAGMLRQLGYVFIPQPPRITIRRSEP